MTAAASLPRMSRPRGELTPADREALLSAMTAQANAERDYRAAVLEAVERSSFRAVAEVTGLSTNTIQRWKRDAS